MSPQDVLDALTAAVPGVGGEVAFGQATLDVPAARWVEAARVARDQLGAEYFDWLSAVDDGAAGLVVIVHLWSLPGRFHVLLRTRVSDDGAALDSLTGVFPGAAWHERETAEMFGLRLAGFDDGSGQGVRPLLLAEEFPGHPLRKDFSSPQQ